MTNHLPKWVTQLTENDVKSLLESDKEIMRQFARWISEPGKVIALQCEVTRLAQENLRLRTVMLAAHDEIKEHWDSHCDSGGGPVNLMNNLERGTGFYPGYVDCVVNLKSDSSDS